jgi:hypothetical protein
VVMKRSGAEVGRVEAERPVLACSGRHVCEGVVLSTKMP